MPPSLTCATLSGSSPAPTSDPGRRRLGRPERCRRRLPARAEGGGGADSTAAALGSARSPPTGLNAGARGLHRDRAPAQPAARGDRGAERLRDRAARPARPLRRAGGDLRMAAASWSRSPPASTARTGHQPARGHRCRSHERRTGSTTGAGGRPAVLSFDSPPLNLFDQRMIDDFQAAVAALAAEPPRALLIRPRAAVSGGVDVHVFEGLTPEQGSRLWDELLGTIDQLEALLAPIVFAAHAPSPSPPPSRHRPRLRPDRRQPQGRLRPGRESGRRRPRWVAPSASPSAPAAAAPASS